MSLRVRSCGSYGWTHLHPHGILMTIMMQLVDVARVRLVATHTRDDYSDNYFNNGVTRAVRVETSTQSDWNVINTVRVYAVLDVVSRDI